VCRRDCIVTAIQDIQENEIVKKSVSLIVLSWTAFILAACHSHIELQYTPEQYARLRGIELLTTPPTRPYELVANVEGSGGRFTAKETMINAMIDTAQKAGARALIPMEFTGEGRNAGQTRPVTGLDLFVYTENNRTITKGRAIRWLGN
jgi:hypothetical protein